MKWLIIVMIVGGEPTLVEGWMPREVSAVLCDKMAERASAYIERELGITNSATCSETLNQEAIDKAISKIGVSL